MGVRAAKVCFFLLTAPYSEPGRLCLGCKSAKIKCAMTKEGSRRGRVGMEKKSGKQKEVEEDDEVVVVGIRE